MLAFLIDPVSGRDWPIWGNTSASVPRNARIEAVRLWLHDGIECTQLAWWPNDPA